MNSVLLIPLLVSFVSFKEVQGVAKNYAEILRTLKYPERLIFDISPPGGFKSGAPDDILNVIYRNDFEGIGRMLSPFVYCYRGYRGYFVPEDTIRKLMGSNGEDWAGGVTISHSILFQIPSEQGQGPSSNADFDPTLNKTFLEIVENNPEYNFVVIFYTIFDIPSSSVNGLLRLITGLKSQYRNIRVGLEYTQSDYGAFHSHYLKLRDVVDVTITITYSLSLHRNLLLSYNQFASKLRDIISEQKYFFQTENPNRVNYILLYWSGNDPITEDKRRSYDYYLLQFAVLWLNEGGQTGIIFHGINRTLAYGNGFDGDAVVKLVSTKVDAKEVDKFGVCEIKAMFDHAAHHFNSVTLHKVHDSLVVLENADKCILSSIAGCPENRTESEVCNRPDGRSNLPDIFLRYWISWDKINPRQVLTNLTRAFDGLPLKQFGTYTGNINSTNYDVGELTMDVATTCSYEIGGIWGINKEPIKNEDFIQQYWEPCTSLWAEASIVVWEFVYSPNVLSLYDLLTAAELRRQRFMKLFPDKKVTFRFTIYSFGDGVDVILEEGLYCQLKLQGIYDIVAGVVHFARIHNISIEFDNFFGYLEKNYMGWSPVETIDDLNLNETRFPVFVNRNFPKNFLLGDFPVDPCITQTMEVPKAGIEVDIQYIGITLYMGGMKKDIVTADELQVMLQFVLHKFSLIELKAETFHGLETVLSLLSRSGFVDKLTAQNDSVAQLYINIDLAIFSAPKNQLLNTLIKFEKTVLKPTGIHFQNRNMSEHLNQLELDNLKNAGILVGISLEDCVGETNNRFRSLRSFQLFPQLDYMICNIKQSIRATNIDRVDVAKHLGTSFYINKYFKRMFPNETTEMLFRLNTVPSKSHHGEVPDFLKFFSDVSQFASLNNLKIFVSPAFDNIDGSRFGWWKIYNFGNLRNVSVYTDKQSEYLGRDTWRPVQEEEGGQPHLSVVLFGVAAIAIVMLVMVVALLVTHYYKRRYALLTKKEVDEFRYGKKVDKWTEVDQAQIYANLEFPKQYVIPLNRFQLFDILGQGEFGVVRNANLSDEEGSLVTRVAVKVPTAGCSKNSFRSMLSELKILCYVGQHRHVIRFLGAYIKEIGKGVVYIATEFCENGSLQEYLRGIQSEEYGQTTTTSDTHNPYCGFDNLSEVASSSNVDKSVHVKTPNISELCRFSHEIAQGMDYIAYKKIVHGDLATRNVLLDSDLQCKISDFGLSRKLYEYQEYIKKSAEPLPWRWLAIESLKRMEFTTKSDVWGYGVTLWEIFNLGSVPYSGLSWSPGFVNELDNGLRLSVPKFAPMEIFEKLETCWDNDPERRPSFKELADYLGTMRDKAYAPISDA